MNTSGYILPKSYRKLGLLFFFISILIFIFAAYLIWAKVIIVITANGESIDQELVFDVDQNEDDDGIVSGKVLTLDVEGSSTFSASGSKVLTSDVVGEVTIVNNYSKEQILVETTRLAYADNPDKVILRLNNTVTVQPGTEVKVQVYPEDFENFKELEPGQFIIPGLWEPLQEFIFAKNDTTLNKERVEVAVVEESDFQAAEEELKQQLYQKALSRVNEQIEAQEALWPKLINSNVQEVSHNAAVGDEVSEFTTTMKLQAVVVIFDEDEVIDLAKKRLANGSAISINPSQISYELQKYNIESDDASVKAAITAKSIVMNSDDIFDKSQLTGLTEEEIKSYFSQFSEVSNVEVQFNPAWLKKTPRFQDKIEIRFAQ